MNLANACFRGYMSRSQMEEIDHRNDVQE